MQSVTITRTMSVDHLQRVITATMHPAVVQASLPTGPDEHFIQHGRGDPAGEGVLLARVVAAEDTERLPAAAARRERHRDGRAVPELRARPWHREPSRAQRRPQRLPGEPAEADDDPDLGDQPRELRDQPGGTGITLD